VLSREEIEGELRDLFAKMSPIELERELNGAWRELVEEELANRSEAKRLEASRIEESLVASSRPVESRLKKSLARKTPANAGVALIDAAPLPTPPQEANWRSRIAGFLRSIFKQKPR
jgi:hypothetical protein